MDRRESGRAFLDFVRNIFGVDDENAMPNSDTFLLRKISRDEHYMCVVLDLIFVVWPVQQSASKCGLTTVLG